MIEKREIKKHMSKIFTKIFVGLLSLLFISCAEIKPLQLSDYHPPDLSKIVRPEIPKPVEGKDYFIDEEKGTVTYTLSGQNLLTAKVLSEKDAWIQVELLKQIIGTQIEIIRQDRELIVIIDLKRQYAEKSNTVLQIKTYAAEIISVILMGLTLAK